MAHNDKHTNPRYVEAIKLKGCHFGSVRRSLVLVGIGNGVGNWVVRGDPGGGGEGEAKKNNEELGEWDNRAHERCVLATFDAIATC